MSAVYDERAERWGTECRGKECRAAGQGFPNPFGELLSD
jgi:hypothetical protein